MMTINGRKYVKCVSCKGIFPMDDSYLSPEIEAKFNCSSCFLKRYKEKQASQPYFSGR